jgi:hypothetical protein
MTRLLKDRDVIRIAKQNNLNVTECNGGSHFKLTAPNGDVMTCYHGEMSKGVSCKIIKWLLKLGIFVTCCVLIYAYIL